MINHRLTSFPPFVPQAHDESNMCGPGDKVLMVHSRPLSKHKKWVVTEILRKERVYDHGNVGKKKESLLFDGDAAAASARLADLRARKALSASRLAECEALLEHAARRL